MPKIDIDYETLDNLVAAALQDLLEGMLRDADRDDEEYAKDIAALRRVLRIYQ